MKKTNLEKQIAEDEDYRPKPYRCPAGKLTVGYGYNLDAGMPEDEAHILLRYRIYKIKKWLRNRFSWFDSLSENRQAVIISMVYQMGEAGFLGFHQTIKYIEAGQHAKASEEMLDSEWYRKDSPARAKRLSIMYREG